MTKAKISEYDAVAANNTDVNGVNIAEGCPPSGMNNMGREIMAALKRFQTGADGDSVTVGGSLVVSNTLTAGPVSATTLNTSGAVVFNDAGADVDFRVESDTNTHAFFVEGSSGNVGIGDTPVGGKVNANSTRVTIAGTNAASYGAEFIAAGTNASIAIGSGGGASYVWTAENYPMVFATNGIERMRILSSGGITFNGDTAAANALDDYEEGTWTPTITGSTTNPTITYGTPRTGVYTKIGRVVYWNISMNINASSGGSGNFRVSLPMAVASGGEYFGWSTIYTAGMNWGVNNTFLTIRMEENASTFNIYGFANNSGNNTSVAVALPQTNLAQIYASGFYTAA